MYQSYYDLTGKPFRLSPDPAFFFPSRGHKRALAYLRYGLHQNEGFVVITGAASPRGLGKSMAQLFAEHGATNALLDLDETAAQNAARDLGPQHVGMACDVTDQSACERAIGNLLERWGAIDILVNNAGITQPLKIMEVAQQTMTRSLMSACVALFI